MAAALNVPVAPIEVPIPIIVEDNFEPEDLNGRQFLPDEKFYTPLTALGMSNRMIGDHCRFGELIQLIDVIDANISVNDIEIRVSANCVELKTSKYYYCGEFQHFPREAKAFLIPSDAIVRMELHVPQFIRIEGDEEFRGITEYEYANNEDSSGRTPEVPLPVIKYDEENFVFDSQNDRREPAYDGFQLPRSAMHMSNKTNGDGPAYDEYKVVIRVDETTEIDEIKLKVCPHGLEFSSNSYYLYVEMRHFSYEAKAVFLREFDAVRLELRVPKSGERRTANPFHLFHW